MPLDQSHSFDLTIFDSNKGIDLKSSSNQICTRCIYDDSINGISFDDEGVCNYCHIIDDLQSQYATGTLDGQLNFESIVKEIKVKGRSHKYDIAIGVSGGVDSSYLLWLAKEYGLRPLAVHYDNTWNTAIATQNISKMTKSLDIDLYTHVCDNKESDDIFKSFLLAGVPELDGPTDIALAEVMYRAANKYNIQYVFEGHSFIAEGVSPLGKAYVDGSYIADVHKKHGSMIMSTFPNMTFRRFLFWILVRRIKKVRPFWYLSYSKEEAKAFLSSNFGWEDYGGHHLENRMSAFHHSFYTPLRFKLDQRNNSLGASVRSGLISRDTALDIYSQSPFIEPGLVEFVLKRFDITPLQFQSLLQQQTRFYTDYKTYKRRFELFRPIFFILAKANLVPMSFYLKYCFPAKSPS